MFMKDQELSNAVRKRVKDNFISKVATILQKIKEEGKFPKDLAEELSPIEEGVLLWHLEGKDETVFREEGGKTPMRRGLFESFKRRALLKIQLYVATHDK